MDEITAKIIMYGNGKPVLEVVIDKNGNYIFRELTVEETVLYADTEEIRKEIRYEETK